MNMTLTIKPSFHLADRSIHLSLSAGETLVDTLDQIFGSNESSKAISAFSSLVYKEMLASEGCSVRD
jgi:hypothetical protein